MKGWLVIATGTVIAALVAAYVLVVRTAPSDRDQILGLVADAQQGINQRVFSRVLKYIADNYHDSMGNTKATLQRLAMQAAGTAEQYRLATTVRGLVISGDRRRATILVEATLYLISSGDARTYNVTAKLEKRGRRWLVVNAEGWQEAADEPAGGGRQ
ncbi:MAG: hypothetical protein H5T86_08235 [Armatimonadetes bacterium]|nr:hypothetical protein [Armatimonadota bacterium]